MVVDGCGEAARDPPDSCEVIYARAGNRLKSAELSQEFPAPLRAEAWNLFQRRGRSPLVPSSPVRGDSEAVSFVTKLLNEVQSLRRCWKTDGPGLTRHIETFTARATSLPLCYAD